MLAALIDRVTFRFFVLNMNCSSSYRIDSTINNDYWLNIFLSKPAFFISAAAQIFIDKGTNKDQVQILTRKKARKHRVYGLCFQADNGSRNTG